MSNFRLISAKIPHVQVQHSSTCDDTLLTATSLSLVGNLFLQNGVGIAIYTDYFFYSLSDILALLNMHEHPTTGIMLGSRQQLTEGSYTKNTK